jgi:hypothetical protein
MDTRKLLVGLGVALALAGAGAGAALAQAPGVTGPETRFYLMVGGGAFDLDGLNGALAGGGFDEVSGNTVSVGGGGHVVLGRWIVGGEGFGLMPRESDTSAGDWRARVSGGGGVVNLGYSVLRKGGTSVYPLIGVGAGALTVEMSERSTPTFDQVISNPARGSTVTQVTMLVQPAVGIDHFVPVGTTDGLVAGFVVGVRAGYTFAPMTSDWYLDTMRLPGGPKQGMEGAFVRVTIGGGTRRLPQDGLAESR